MGVRVPPFAPSPSSPSDLGADPPDLNGREPLHTIAFEARSVRRPRRYELRLFVDGVDLCDLVRGVELPYATAEGRPELAGAYAGHQWPVSSGREEVIRHYLGQEEEPYLDAGRSEILVCRCGQIGCWPLACRIEASGETVSWADFAQPHRSGVRRPLRHPGIWPYEGFGPFLFDRGRYQAALLAALAGVLEE